jgi:hypothetical protein
MFAQNSSSIDSDLKIFGTDAIFLNTYPGIDYSSANNLSFDSAGGNKALGATPDEDETTNADGFERANEAMSESGIFGLEF